MPSQTQFSAALAKIGKPRGRQLKFLQAHYNAPKRALNMSRLAKAAGYRNYRAVNLQYGLLAARIASRIGVAPPPVAISLLVGFIRPRQASNTDYILVMNESFARALKGGGWVT